MPTGLTVPWRDCFDMFSTYRGFDYWYNQYLIPNPIPNPNPLYETLLVLHENLQKDIEISFFSVKNSICNSEYLNNCNILFNMFWFRLTRVTLL